MAQEYEQEFRLLEDTRAAMVASQSHVDTLKLGHSTRSGFWPSLCSIARVEMYKNVPYEVIEGSCLRQSYYRMTGQSQTDVPDPSMHDIWDLGSAAEEIYKQRFQGLDTYRVLFPTVMGEKLRFQNPHTGVRGEADLVLQHKESGVRFGVEMKSYYGFWAAMEIAGYDAAFKSYSVTPYIPVADPRRSKAPFPKLANLMQTILYLEEFWDDGIQLWKIIYVSRDKGPSKEFDVTLKYFKGRHCAVVDGVTIPWINCEGIHKRFKELQEAIDKKELPSRDFLPEYSTDYLITDQMPTDLNVWHQIKHIEWKENIEGKQARAKSAAKRKSHMDYAIANGNSDWQCNFCPYRARCLQNSDETDLF